jgi:hypothetical protein
MSCTLHVSFAVLHHLNIARLPDHGLHINRSISEF